MFEKEINAFKAFCWFFAQKNRPKPALFLILFLPNFITYK